jgi:alkyl hydroperoxide reductase subunit AhpF
MPDLSGVGGGGGGGGQSGSNYDGRAAGSTGTQFEQFGGQPFNLHNDETVVTRAQGDSLAAMLRDEVAKSSRAGSDMMVVRAIDSMREEMAAREERTNIAFRDALAQLI